MATPARRRSSAAETLGKTRDISRRPDERAQISPQCAKAGANFSDTTLARSRRYEPWRPPAALSASAHGNDLRAGAGSCAARRQTTEAVAAII
jgi:hypothetical protein